MRRAALLLALALAAPAGAQETVVAGVSTDKIALTANFTGSEVLVFGAIRRDAPIPQGQAPLDVIITLRGPPATVMVRRKERRFGIWINTEGVRIRLAPSYYAVASTRPLEQILSETERLRHQLGFDQAVRRVGAHPELADTAAFADALVRLRVADGLYAQMGRGVDLAEQTLFQARFVLPTNVAEGDYAADFHLVRDQAVISRATTEITVQKAGLERWLFNLSRQRPFAYGVLAVAVALAAGWLAAAVFKLARR